MTNRKTRRMVLATIPMAALLILFVGYAIWSTSPNSARATIDENAGEAQRVQEGQVRAKREAILNVKAAKGQLDVIEAEELQELKQQDKTDERLRQCN